MSMKAEYSPISGDIVIRFDFKSLPVSDRRSILNDLLADLQTCPGQTSMPSPDRAKLYDLLDTYCGWNK
jgi:hypothetical protein